MNATAHFEWPIRPDRIEVSSLGYLAAAILLSDRSAARTPPCATVHRLVPRRARPMPAPMPSDELRRAAEA